MQKRQKKQKKLALSMRGGGARAVGYLGVLKVLEENDIHVDYIVGSSGGAMVGGAYAVGKSIEEITEFFKKFRTYNVLHLNSIKKFALTDNLQNMEYARKFLGHQNIAETKIKLWIQATNLNKWRCDYFASGDLSAAILASSAAPIVLEPMLVSDNEYIDGDFSATYATSFLKSKGADVVIGLVPSASLQMNRKLPLWRQLILPMSISQALLREQDLLTDPVDLLIGGFGSKVTTFDFKKADELIAEGYQIGLKFIDKIKELVYYNFQYE
jgi:NTE family protein